MKVLLIVDMQNDFCAGGALAVPDGEKTVEVTNSLLQDSRYDLRVASLDWNPKRHCSFASSHQGGRIFEKIPLNGVDQTLWPEHCIQGTKGASLHKVLNRSLIDKYLYKGIDRNRDSYSTFFDNSGRSPTELHQYLLEQSSLRGERPDTIELEIVGLATDYCVKFTALDARKLGLKTTVIHDGCRAVNLNVGDGEAALREMAKAGVKIIGSREILHKNRDREIALQMG